MFFNNKKNDHIISATEAALIKRANDLTKLVRLNQELLSSELNNNQKLT